MYAYIASAHPRRSLSDRGLVKSSAWKLDERAILAFAVSAVLSNVL